MLASELATRKFSYTRSDGSQWALSLKDVLDRIASFEMGYNLNDCVELRWGAAEGSDEASTWQTPCAGRATRENVGLPHLVPAAALADACELNLT